VGLLFGADQRFELRQALGGALAPSAVHPEGSLCTEGRIAAWKARGLAICAWTVDDPGTVARLARAGVDAIVCNGPGAVRDEVRRATGR
jgi:glycerophosphoryl diester phosphodiesterase